MRFAPFPSQAAWRHRDARSGFEVAFFGDSSDSHRLTGHTTAEEEGVVWSVGYDVRVDRGWRTRSASVTSLAATGSLGRHVEWDETVGWTVDGERRGDLAGCIDVDLESSAVTNTLPLHRLDLEVGRGIDVPAVFVRASDLRVERLEQRYTLIAVEEERIMVHYESSTFSFETDLVYDRSGLVSSYPGLAERHPTADQEEESRRTR